MDPKEGTRMVWGLDFTVAAVYERVNELNAG